MSEEDEYEEEEDDEQSQKQPEKKPAENPVIEQKSEEKKEVQSKKTKGSKKTAKTKSTKNKKSSKVNENAYILPSPENVVSTRAFLEQHVTSAIQEALLDLARKRDQIEDPLLYVGEYLVKKAKQK